MTTREVVLDGGSPWGFRLHGGADVNQPLRISRVNPGSKAALRGIREGDFITSINNQSTKDISNAEAHALLRNSGDTLKLGLNEDGNGSPKRRQYKTVHQETHSETVKKSSVTSYTVTSSKTVSQTESNDQKTSKVNGNTNTNGDPIDQTKNPPVSQRSTISSTCSSSSSTPSTYTSLTSPSGYEMADNSRSRRKRTRNNRKKNKQNVNTTEIITEESGEYCVESPKRIKSPEKKKPIKSRSLDDDDLIKIQELSEGSGTEDKSECKGIISEAESDVEWEITETMEEPEIQTGIISTLSLPLKECTTSEVTLMSPEEELSLRNFLEGLNLVNCPEDAFRQIREVSTMESVKSRRAKKRAVLEQYFSPMVHNPRYLDVISEETSDLSDREQPTLTQHLKQGTPEPELPPRPPKSRKVIDNPTILVGTKIIEVPCVTHEICSTSVPQSSSNAEVVYLEDSSNSTTPDPKSDNDDEKDTVDEVLSSTNSSVPDLREFESVEEKKQIKFTVKKNDVFVGSCESLTGEKSWSSQKSDEVKSEYVIELTPPPTPDDLSHKNESSVEKKENFADAIVQTVEEIKENLDRHDSHISDGTNIKESSKDGVKNVEDMREVGSSSASEEKFSEVKIGVEHVQDKFLRDAESRNTSRSEIPKERIIQVKIEHAAKPGPASSEDSFKRMEFLKEFLEDTSKIDATQESTFEDNFSRTGTSKEVEIDNKLDKQSVERNDEEKFPEISKERIIKVEVEDVHSTQNNVKERIVEVRIENKTAAQEKAPVDTRSKKILESNFKESVNKSEAPKETIIEVKIENGSKVAQADATDENVAELTSKDLFTKFEDKTEETTTEFSQNNSCNSETSKERIIEVKIEDDYASHLPKPQINLGEKSNETSKIPKERIIEVKRETDQKTIQTDIFREVDIRKTEVCISSPKIIKLDDMNAPTVITPVNSDNVGKKKNPTSVVKNISINVESPKTSSKLEPDKCFTKTKERKIEITKSEDFASPRISKIDNNERFPHSEKYKVFSSISSSKKGKSHSADPVSTKKIEKASGIEEEDLDKPFISTIKLPPKPPERSGKNSIQTQTDSEKIERQIPIKSETTEPKPTKKQSESPSKEVENISRLPESIFYSNVLSPPAPSPSSSLSSGSSSRATSLCTAKYNSMSSSIADITSIKDEELLKGNKTESPLTLRELCVNFLMAQPFGGDILQELADVSSSIEHLTQSLLSDGSKTSLPAFMEETSSKDNWVGLQSESDPKVVVYLSPTQKTQLDKSRRVSDEASKLLDLHQKFIYRTTYHDVVERQVKNDVEITSIKPDVSNRLLAIIRDAQEPKFRKFSTLPRNMESARLRAKDLSEWLQLARNKSRSELNLTDENNQNVGNAQRRNSLPQDFYEQMYYLQEKEREIQRELEMLEEEKRKLAAEMTPKKFRLEDYHISKRGDFAESKKLRPLSMPVSTEYFRQQMYEEYMDQIAAREERKQHKVIKVSQIETTPTSPKAAPGIEDEFMIKVKEKQKLGKLKLDETSDDKTNDESDPLPKHIQEFMDIAKLSSEKTDSNGVWSPGQKQEGKSEEIHKIQSGEAKDEPISPVWTPKSATSSPVVERKEFRPVKFESPVLSRKSFSKTEEIDFSDLSSREPRWKIPETSSDTGIILSSTLEKRLPTSHSSPASGFNDFPTTRLPRAQNPTITLLQKAREGQLPKGALYIEQDQSFRRPQNERPPIVGPGEILYKIKNEYTSESDSEKPRKMADLGPRKYEGIGPITKDGMPLILRSEVKDANQSKWYKKMYDTIHKQKPHRDEFVTVRYKQRRGQYPYTSGYLSEPEPGAYDSDFTDYKYATLDRRRLVKDKENDYVVSSTMPRAAPDKVGSSVIKHGHDPYKNQPGRIENYIPGHSSISEKEAKEWWDEVMDIFDVHLEQQKRVPQTKSFMNQALKESGYESDSTLVFRRRDDKAQQLSPLEQKEAYKVIQKGGDVPLHGLRKPAPERPKESPRKYVENEVTIHYKTPVRQEIKEYLSEDELAYRQAEAMKKIYQEERRRKYLQVSKSLQELQDMNNRRHTDNFIPSQKSPIPLNRYDDFDDLSPPVKPRPRSPEPRLMARALYNFVGQTARELTFRKGDLIYVRRQVDKNWYEGELNAMVGLFPVNYVEIVTYDTAKTAPRKSHEGQARAKYNFVAQTHLELSLAKGELVVITRRVDDNWFEGKIGGRKGIFPVSYVEVLVDPSDPPPPSSKPVAAPAAHSLLLNGSAGGKESMGSHSYTPTLSVNQLTSSYHAKPVQITGSYGSMNRGARSPVGQALHIETQAEPVPYRALYKYLPQNDDELELLEGDTVYVLEKCDDGWYVGSSDRTGAFGTFPGNYVEKI